MPSLPLGWLIAALAAAPLESWALGLDQPRALAASGLAALLFGAAHAARRAIAERDALRELLGDVQQ